MLDKPQAFVILEKFPQPLKASVISVMPDHTTNPGRKEHTGFINRMISKENTNFDHRAYITNLFPFQKIAPTLL